MNALTQSLRYFLENLPVGASLKYISGAGEIIFREYSKENDSAKVSRGDETIELRIASMEDLAEELLKGKPIHVETFYHSGGNRRTVIETIFAHLPNVAWKKINNLKHLQCFDHEIHIAGGTLKLGSSDWTSPEWALATLIYLDVVKATGLATIPVPLPKDLATTTPRNEASWQARIANLRSSETGGGFDGGENTKKLCRVWIGRANESLDEVRAIASHAFKDGGDVALVEAICGKLSIPVPRKEVQVPTGCDQILRCLAAKLFVILTGNSGTGKTKLAERMAETFCDSADSDLVSAMVAVGADWTDSRAVVGFVNHLRSAKLNGATESHPVYQSTGVLDLMLAANQKKEWPHFLILDEMNLSHVERYFADFLSAMEARQGMIRLHDEGPRDDPEFRLPRFENDPSGVPRELPYPPNLFVIGTVNIDETTYMFSPKVLDRAHVIEFQVDSDDIRGFLGEPKELETSAPAGEAAAKAFLQLSLDARSGKLDPLIDPEKTEITNHLISLLEILQRGRFEFAYRTANEVTRYLRVCRHLAEDKAAWSEEGWKTSLDDEILQKILPRLHGSRNRLGPLLGALACYLHAGDRKAADEYFPAEGDELAAKSIGDSEFRAMAEAAAMFPRSFAKIKMMSEVLVEEQFVSFIC